MHRALRWALGLLLAVALLGARSRTRRDQPLDRSGHLHLITAFLSGYETYHHHKEVMAYTASALYVSAATAFLFAPPRPVPRSCVLLLATVVVVLALLGLLYVNWQLRQREVAAGRAEACSTVASRWLHRDPEPADLVPVEYPPGDGTFWPKVLAVEFCQQEKVVSRRLRIPNWVTRIALILAALGALWRVMMLVE
jgi:hypothetical protein